MRFHHVQPVAFRRGDWACAHRAFTLLELLVVVAVIGILAALLLPAVSRVTASARAVQCLGQMRQVGLALRLYADDHGEELPRSQHSAFAHGQATWGKAITLQLGVSEARWTNLLEGVYRCPSDRRRAGWSYGLNVYFELGPSDDYFGAPITWRRISLIPHPSATVMLAENASEVDHIMAHFWMRLEDASDVAGERHRERSNHLFLDGHAEGLALSNTYAPPHIDLWNPLTAR